MGAEENKELIRRYMAAVDTGNPDVLDDYLAPDFVDHNPFPGTTPDLQGMKDAFNLFLEATPGDHRIEDLVAEGDKVVARISAKGTHEADLFGVPATHNPLTMTGIAIWRIADGKIVEHWNQTDVFGVMVQIGAVSPPGT
jgi:predicted ester cyclase